MAMSSVLAGDDDVAVVGAVAGRAILDHVLRAGLECRRGHLEVAPGSTVPQDTPGVAVLSA